MKILERQVMIKINQFTCTLGALLALSFAGRAEDTPVAVPASHWHATGINLGTTETVSASDEKSPGSGPVIAFKYDLRAPEGEDSYCSYENTEEVTLDDLPKSLEIWIKGDKRQFVQVILNLELNPWIALGFQTAFVDLFFHRGRLSRGDQPRQQQRQ